MSSDPYSYHVDHNQGHILSYILPLVLLGLCLHVLSRLFLPRSVLVVDQDLDRCSYSIQP